MKIIKLVIPLLLLNWNYSIGQIKNYDFEIWESVFSYEQPQSWYCNGLSFGACTKFTIDSTNHAVRMDNSLPCVDNEDPSQSKSLGYGTLSQYFKVPSNEFDLSYDLVIDSIDMPAAFHVRLFGYGIGEILHATHDDIFDGNVTHHISLDTSIDSLRIRLAPIGIEKEMAAHDCDLGYISAIIDNIKVESTVRVSEIKKERVSIYPNPSSGIVYIEQRDLEIRRVVVYDIYGRILANQIGGNKLLWAIDLKELGNLFLVKVIYENGEFEFDRILIN